MMAFERRFRYAGFAIVAGLVSTMQARTVLAETSAAQKETARNLMTEGRALRDQHDLQGALARFRAADAIMGVPTTSLELAKAQADLGFLVEARSTIHKLRTTPAADDEPLPFQEARSKADAFDAELNARIGSLRFVLSGLSAGSEARISVDGDLLPMAAASMPYRVNPGHHHIDAEAAHRQVVAEVDVNEHDQLDIPLVFQPDSEPVATEPKHSSRIPALAYVAGGVGIGGVLVGAVSGALALSKKHSAQAGCSAGKCPPSTWHDLDSASSLATTSTIGFVVGTVGLGVSVGMVLFSSPSRPPSVQAALGFGRGAGSLALSGSF